jgi:uncharacterized protein (DUF305 family)
MAERRWIMHRVVTPIVAAGLVILGLLGFIVTASYMQPVVPLGTAPASGMDAMFIEQMIPHHDDAIEMAELALTRAEHPEIRQLAADIKRTQTAENAQMRTWYREWFGTAVPDVEGSSSMMGGMMGSGAADMTELEVAEPFDKAFIEAMIPHHRTAIMMSRMAGGASGRLEMRGLTSTVIETQSAEIAKMQAWYDEWYGR